MNYISVCSGIESASVAWEPLNWVPIAFSEIETFPCELLKHRFPNTPNWGDMTKFKDWPDADVDVLVGGTPCQSFSLAGLREGLADPRGNLLLTYLAIAARYRPRWLVWENVPGVLSSGDGRDFGTLLGGLAKLGYGFAYRVLDAQYIRVESHARAVPQRRRRVFVVGCLGDWRSAAAVLLEREGLLGHPAPRRGSWQGVAGTIEASTGRSRGAGISPGALTAAGSLRSTDGGSDVDHARASHLVAAQVAPTLHNMGKAAGTATAQDAENGALVSLAVDLRNGCLTGEVAHTLQSHHQSNSLNAEPTLLVQNPALLAFGGNNTGGPIDAAAALNANRGCHNPGDFEAGTLLTVTAFSCKDHGADAGEVSPTLRAMTHSDSHSNGGGQVAVAFDEAQITNKDNRSIPGPVCGTMASTSRMHVAFTGDGETADPIMAAEGKTYTQEGSNNFRMHNVVEEAPRMLVRRLTPLECERLQGFPDNWTKISINGKPAADAPRYKAIGNSMAVNVMSWIGRRIAMVDAISRK